MQVGVARAILKAPKLLLMDVSPKLKSQVKELADMPLSGACMLSKPAQAVQYNKECLHHSKLLGILGTSFCASFGFFSA